MLSSVKDSSDRSWLQGASPRRYACSAAGCFRVAESWCVASRSHELTVELNTTQRPPGDTSAWFHIRSRNERTCCPIPIYNAFRTRSILLLCQIYRRIVSPIRAANTRRGTQRSQGLFILSISNDAKWTHNAQLLDRCLKIVDPELFSYLRMKNLSAEIYAFPCLFFHCLCPPEPC